MMRKRPADCPHDDVTDTTTWGDLGRGVERGLCVDCGLHLVRDANDDWEPAT